MMTNENSTATHRVTDVTDHFVIAVTRACALRRETYTNNPSHPSHASQRRSLRPRSSRRRVDRN
jgi:hypothetical protein